MKELSIKEKAKAYDRVSKEVKDFFEGKQKMYSDVEQTLEYLFPDLKESKEEKTERILHSISSKMSLHLRDIFTEEEFQCFDTWSNVWLEKQGEQKLPIEKLPEEMKTIEESLGIDSETYNKIVDECIYGEQKPNYTTLAETGNGGINALVTRELSTNGCGEQKPAWSEEDEVMIKVFDSIIRYIVEVVDKDALERFGTNREELFSWLKSLRPQSKQEWSEEDNWIKTKIIKVLLGCETFLTSEETNECIDWIKSIKQRLKDKS